MPFLAMVKKLETQAGLSKINPVWISGHLSQALALPPPMTNRKAKNIMRAMNTMNIRRMASSLFKIIRIYCL